jgi:hypothetical protein
MDTNEGFDFVAWLELEFRDPQAAAELAAQWRACERARVLRAYPQAASWIPGVLDEQVLGRWHTAIAEYRTVFVEQLRTIAMAEAARRAADRARREREARARAKRCALTEARRAEARVRELLDAKRGALSRWLDAGFSESEARAWLRACFDPNTAQTWRERGFTPGEAKRWRAAGCSAAEAAMRRTAEPAPKLPSELDPAYTSQSFVGDWWSGGKV